jgi:hypothetical protein
MKPLAAIYHLDLDDAPLPATAKALDGVYAEPPIDGEL